MHNVMNSIQCPVELRKETALYGLAANPPHVGHWACVKNLVERGYNVLVVPSYSHAFGKKMAPYELRVEWLKKSGAEFGALSERAKVWCVEDVLAKAKSYVEPIYSVEVLRAAREEFGGVVRLALGPDYLDGALLSNFRNASEIMDDFGVVHVPSAGNIRSTIIRDLIAGGKADLSEHVGLEISQSVSDFFVSQAQAKLS